MFSFVDVCDDCVFWFSASNAERLSGFFLAGFLATGLLDFYSLLGVCLPGCCLEAETAGGLTVVSTDETVALFVSITSSISGCLTAAVCCTN